MTTSVTVTGVAAAVVLRAMAEAEAAKAAIAAMVNCILMVLGWSCLER